MVVAVAQFQPITYQPCLPQHITCIGILLHPLRVLTANMHSRHHLKASLVLHPLLPSLVLCRHEKPAPLKLSPDSAIDIRHLAHPILALRHNVSPRTTILCTEQTHGLQPLPAARRLHSQIHAAAGFVTVPDLRAAPTAQPIADIAPHTTLKRHNVKAQRVTQWAIRLCCFALSCKAASCQCPCALDAHGQNDSKR
jgi:hypothetical protein